MGRRRKAEVEDVPMELTPMIDVTFLLLIFFIVTIKFKVLEGKLETELPKDVGVNTSPIDDILEKVEITIQPDPSREEGMRVLVNSQVMPNMTTFRARLKAFVENNPEQRATLYPELGINYEQVVKVVDQCLMADLTDITFAGVTFDA